MDDYVGAVKSRIYLRRLHFNLGFTFTCKGLSDSSGYNVIPLDVSCEIGVFHSITGLISVSEALKCNYI